MKFLLIAILALLALAAGGKPTHLVYDATNDPSWTQPIQAAATSWGLSVKIIENCKGNPVICKQWAPDAPYGWTWLSHNKALITINSWWDERTALWDSPAWGSQHVRQYIACHEIGHSLGLPERPTDIGCMEGNPAYYLPSAEDLEMVR